MRIVLLSLLLTLSSAGQPRVEELTKDEQSKFTPSLAHKAFPGHECAGLAHMLRLLKVNGRVHGLALHQVNLHNGQFSWKHYLWDGRNWRQQGPGLPDPAAGDEHLVLPEPAAEDIQRNFKDLVKALQLQEWPHSAQEKLLNPEKIFEF
jgi:hypothetical protein